MKNPFMNHFTKSLLRKAFCVLIASVLSTTVFAQEINKNKTLRQARKALYKEKYTEAQAEYLKLVNAEPTNDVYNFEAGLSYLFSTFQQNKSVPLFEAALQHSSKDTITELYYYLGKAYQLNSEFEKANESFEKFDNFIDHQTKSGKILKSDVLREINYNANGVKYLDEKNNNITIENIGTQVNSLDREYAPVIHQSGEVILFTSRRKYKGNKLDKGDLMPYEDIYAAKKTENGWQLLTDKGELKKYLPENVNTKKHDASITYSADGNTIYTYKKDAIWQSTFNNGNWGLLKKLDETVNASKFNVPSVTISADGNSLFFVSTRKDGIGGKDIYKSNKNANGEWDTPTLLSANINTKDDEDGPYLTEDGKTLYFSSTGHSSIGGYDIFKSELINGEWSTAQSLGIPYNSPADDIFYVIDKTNKNGFFSSSRVEGNGAFDLYSFSSECKNLENTEIRGIVYDNLNRKPLRSNLRLTNNESITDVISTSSLASNGKFLLIAKPENSYILTVEAEGFSSQQITIFVPKQCDYFQLFSEISLEKVTIDNKDYQVATLRNSFFNRAELNANSTVDTAVNVPDFKDDADTYYQDDIAFMAKSRNFTPENTPNFTVISDTIEFKSVAVAAADTKHPEFGPVYFDFDKSNLTKEAKKELDKIATYLKSDEGKDLVLNITGHTDGKRDMELNKKIFAKKRIEFTIEASEQRSKSYNTELSKTRANNVAKYIKQKGVKESQTTINYVGEEEPVAPNKNNDGSNNLENQKLNRRTTLKFSKQNPL
jgi:outer membrane protein OmpA-like peptidoglycan-associated protein